MACSHSDFSIWLRNLIPSFRSYLTGPNMLTPLLTSDLDMPMNFALLLILQSQVDSVEWIVTEKKDFSKEQIQTVLTVAWGVTFKVKEL